MENDLNLNIDEVLNFIDDFELTKDNVQDIIKYVQYKSILDSFTYVIETSKKSPDTGPFIIHYLEITKKLEEVFNKLVEKKNLKKMEQDDKLLDSLKSTVTDVFGWEVDYYLTEKTDEIKVEKSNYDCYTIVDKIKLKVLIPDGYDNSDKNISVVEIPVNDFVTNKEPQLTDLVFFNEMKRFYSVKSSINVGKVFRVELEQYCAKSTLK